MAILTRIILKIGQKLQIDQQNCDDQKSIRQFLNFTVDKALLSKISWKSNLNFWEEVPN